MANAENFASYEYNIKSVNTEKKFYDVENIMNPLHYKEKVNSKHEFGKEYEVIIPKEGEIRLLGNRHRDCRYYSLGLELCKQRILQTNFEDFTPCKNVVDAMYRCYTEDKYGEEYHKTIDVAKPFAKKFLDCYFYKASSLTSCMEHFEDSIRAIYRSDDNKLTDFH
jgi:hypothetical protein